MRIEDNKICLIEKELSKCKSGAEKTQLLLDLAIEYWKDSNYSLSLFNAGQAAISAKKYNINEILARAYNLIGLNYQSQGDYDKAVDSYIKGLDISRASKNIRVASGILSNIGVIFIITKNFEKAVDIFLEASKGSEHFKASAYNNLGATYLNMGQYDKALEFLTEAKLLAHTNGEIKIEAFASSSIADLYAKKCDYVQALHHYNHSLSLTNTEDGLEMYLSIKLKSIIASIDHNSFSQQTGDLVELERKIVKIKRKDILADLYGYLSDVYMRLNDQRKAYIYLKLSNDTLEEINRKNLLTKLNQQERVIEISLKELESLRLIEKISRLSTIGLTANSIAFELKLPLESIKMSADGIIFWNNKNPTYLPQFFIEEMQSISGAATIIDRVISRMQIIWSDTGIYKEHEFNLNDIVRETLTLLTKQINKHSVSLEIRLSNTPIIITSSQLVIQHAIYTIINHFLQNFDASGSETDDKIIQISTNYDDDRRLILIEDNSSDLGLQTEDNLPQTLSIKSLANDEKVFNLVLVKQLLSHLNIGLKISRSSLGGQKFTVSLPADSFSIPNEKLS